jgi:putative acetyltransferase
MLDVLRTTSDNAHFALLVQELDKDLWQRYPDIQASYDVHNKIEKNPNVVVAYVDHVPVGCGCFKKFDTGVVEIKRMFVRREHRSKGIAARILNELCCWAEEVGFERAVLETATRQPEAIHLYKKAGFTTIPNYPPYENMELSICMEKILNN